MYRQTAVAECGNKVLTIPISESVNIAIPEEIRRVFAEWSVHFDPAPLLAGGDPGVLSAIYEQLAKPGGAQTITVRILAEVYANAELNRKYGITADLRREGDAVCAWVAQLLAADSALRGQFVQHILALDT